jgi:hypothetical protein
MDKINHSSSNKQRINLIPNYKPTYKKCLTIGQRFFYKNSEQALLNVITY